ncbi:MAG TPA: isochorismatase family protein [Terrimesophilobacter sp.]|nr:isochorismatase family protein [Terrimesophilobacter sp.]
MSDFSAGFGGTLELGRRPVVLSIDLMRAYFDPGSPLCLPSAASLESAGRVIRAAREAGVPVMHTRTIYGPGGIDGGLFIRKVPALELLIGDNAMNELMPQVAPLESELVLVKQYASAFFGTSLASTLQARGIDTLVIVGVSTSGCIRATAVDALQYGFTSAVVRDAVGDRSDDIHESNLFDLGAKYSQVVREADIVGYLEGDR